MMTKTHFDHLLRFEKESGTIPKSPWWHWVFNVSQDDLRREDVVKWMEEGKVILALSDPQPSDALTAGQLEKRGLLGLYRAEPIMMDGLAKAFTLPPEIAEVRVVVDPLYEKEWLLTRPAEPPATAPTPAPPAEPSTLDSHLL